MVLDSKTQEIDALIALMAKLPGMGPRSARRATLHLIKKRTLLLTPLAEAMLEVAAIAKECLVCGNIAVRDRCDVCEDTRRATGQICVVAEVADLWAMERSLAFKGRYHVLGGSLSALDGVGPEELRIPSLLSRVVDEDVSEVILALNATMDGQTTAHYIAEQIEEIGVTVTSLAQGVPIGGELDYLDGGTISAAIIARKPV